MIGNFDHVYVGTIAEEQVIARLGWNVILINIRYYLLQQEL